MTITAEEIEKLREFLLDTNYIRNAREALAIVEKLPGMLEEYAHLLEENALCENDPCWEYRYRVDAAERELATLREGNDALAAKVASLSPHGSCGCSYDKPDDLCMHHSPQLAAMMARAEAAEAERDALCAKWEKARNAVKRAQTALPVLKTMCHKAGLSLGEKAALDIINDLDEVVPAGISALRASSARDGDNS